MINKSLNYITVIVWIVEKRRKVKNKKIFKTKNGKSVLLSNSKLCDSKKSRLIKEQEATGLILRGLLCQKCI